MKEKLEISFGDNLLVPKYKQIIGAVLQKIQTGDLKKGDRIPSLNSLCKQYGLSQDTVLMAYNELKSKGIISSQVGKGYFIQNENTGLKHRVMLLFDVFTAYKEEVYNAFKNTLGENGSEQIFFYHNNIKIFQSIIDSSIGKFTEYVIMPFEHSDVNSVIAKLPPNKVFILDLGRKQYKNIYPFVCQDFERDIYRILKKNSDLVGKYQRMVLVLRSQKAHFRDIKVGFRDFCKQLPVNAEIVSDIKSFEIKPGDGFIVVDDVDLEYLVRFSIDHQLKKGSDIGIISYNETPLKGIVGSSGITTISTDFEQMGKSMAEMIINNQKLKLDNPFLIYNRNSF